MAYLKIKQQVSTYMNLGVFLCHHHIHNELDILGSRSNPHSPSYATITYLMNYLYTEAEADQRPFLLEVRHIDQKKKVAVSFRNTCSQAYK